jgi:peroxiredoxin Q/BCP
VIGISPDPVASHKKFAEKHGITIWLLSDPEHKVLEAYGAWGLKKMYGKESYGVIRSTVLIDPEAVVRHIWPEVKTKGHAAEVLRTLKELSD